MKDVVREGRQRHIVVALTNGATGLLFTEEFKESGLNHVVVTHLLVFRVQISAILKRRSLI